MFKFQTIEPLHYAALVIVLVVWCALHSAMIAPSVTEYLKARLKEHYRFFRLFFNLFALVTLVPVALFAYGLRTDPLFSWGGYWRIVQVLSLGFALILFVRGARHYDSRQFFGIAQIQDRNTGKAIGASGKLETAGILNVVRHPWYLGGILLIWARPLDISAIVINTVFTGYFIVGSFLEERKLVSEFGDDYIAYQERVSMLIPYKWLLSVIKTAANK